MSRAEIDGGLRFVVLEEAESKFVGEARDNETIVGHDLNIMLFSVADPVEVEKFSLRLIGSLVGVGAEVIALGLEQIGGQTFRAVTVVVSERGAEGRRG